MDPTLADGERAPRGRGPLARVPAGVWWAAFAAAAFAPLALRLGGVLGGAPAAWEGPAQRVLDGDTLVIWQGARAWTVRLDGVDCPESLQPHGAAATEFVRDAVRGRRLRVTVRGRGKYGRLIGEVRLPDGTRLAAALLRGGHAWFNRRYSRDGSLAAIEAEARAARRGLWGRPEAPVEPWVFRHRNR